MASKLSKPELVAQAAEMGVEVPKRATAAQIAELIEAKKAEPQPESEGSAEAVSDSCSKTVKCDGYAALNVREAPSYSAAVVKELENGAEVEVLGVELGWAKLSDGYCVASYLV